ncbi:hypothetical protein JHV56_10005 [Arthrobacter sp. BHU FT2]|nr:hypothetical protein [Arthrobacter sp. BHU FT2]
MVTSSEYAPPAVGAALLHRQDEVDALRFLIAQKRMYSRAKRWLGIRWFGMLVLGLAAPIVAVIWPQSAVIVGSIAGAWIFIGRTLLMYLQKRNTERAAAVQEQFDFYVYGMPQGTTRPKLPSLEDIASAAGPEPEISAVASREKLTGWYVVSPTDPGATAVAIAQRSNASYSYRLLRTTGVVWSTVAVLWAALLTTMCVVAGLSLPTFLVGVVLPLLPAFLDVTEYIVGIIRSGRDRLALSREIEERISDKQDPVTPENLRVWQESLFELRRDTPTVPDALYKLRRTKNEVAMSSAAAQLSQRAHQREE